MFSLIETLCIWFLNLGENEIEEMEKRPCTNLMVFDIWI